MSVLNEIDPRTWMWRAAGAAAVVALVWFGVISPYNKAVSAKAVAVALAHERAEVKPKIDRLESDLRDSRREISTLNAIAEEEKSKQLKAANENTIKYNQVVKQYRDIFAKFNAAFLAKSELADRLRDITEQSSSSAANTSDSGFTKRLGAAYAQCESDVSGLLETASSTNERAAKAEAGLRALKN